jgi:hypothetical protein
METLKPSKYLPPDFQAARFFVTDTGVVARLVLLGSDPKRMWVSYVSPKNGTLSAPYMTPRSEWTEMSDPDERKERPDLRCHRDFIEED